MAVIAAFILPHPPILLPEVGRGQERALEETVRSFEQAAKRIRELRPDTIVLTSPHSAIYADYFHISPGEDARGDLSRFGAQSVEISVRYDSAFVRALAKLAGEQGVPAGVMGERAPKLDHATLIPLRFIQREYSAFSLVRIGLSGLPPLVHYRLGSCIAQTADALDRRVVLIASGDLSHRLREDGPYGFTPEGPEFDSRITAAMDGKDFLEFLLIPQALCEAAAECGLRSFQIMAGALDGKAVEGGLLSYQGPFGVGYGAAGYEVCGQDESRRFGLLYERRQKEGIRRRREQEDAYAALARLSLETYVRSGNLAALPEELPREMLNQKAGVFVSLKKHGRLRGCIGTIAPAQSCVAREILQNAIAAGLEDPRFDPVSPEELEELAYSVDVLGEPEAVAGEQELDPARYGVIVTGENKRGLLLPNLEGVDTVKRQIAIAKEKAGILPEEACQLERFEVVRHL